MKLLRIGEPGLEKPAAIDANGNIRDLSEHIEDINPSALSSESIAMLNSIDLSTLPLLDDKLRKGPCVSGSGKLICIGLNYADHAAETNAPIPSEPVIFMKATSAICGPNDPVIIPRGSIKTDWEVELAVIIGRKAKYITQEHALDYVAGYAVTNDVSEREFQLEREGNWTKGKSCDNFGPLGPWLVSKDEIPDPQKLAMWLKVNNEIMQNGSTSTMVYDVAFLVSYLSQFMSLHPGDVISTGTPPGVGLGLTPPRYLKQGDVIELGIEGLGTQRQDVINDLV